jgi:hypothetical protein
VEIDGEEEEQEREGGPTTAEKAVIASPFGKRNLKTPARASFANL